MQLAVIATRAAPNSALANQHQPGEESVRPSAAPKSTPSYLSPLIAIPLATAWWWWFLYLSSSRSIPTTTTSSEDALRERGVQAASQIAADADASLIAAWCAWWDAQPEAGQGVLVNGIKSGNWPPRAKARVIDEQKAYGEQIRDWLTKNFPELDRPGYGPHPAAVAAVIQLHHQHGKGRLTKREHGREIRNAVASFNEKWGTKQTHREGEGDGNRND